MTGAQRRAAPLTFSVIPQITTRVARAENGAAKAGVCSGTSESMSNTMEMTVTGSSMMIVPETVGVSTRRKSYEPLGQKKLEERGDDDQGGEHRRPRPRRPR